MKLKGVLSELEGSHDNPMNGTHPNQAALLDYKKAFDLVDHNLLIAKLYCLGVKPTAVNWVADFLRDRYRRVKPNSDCFSDYKPVPAGIPQGTLIGSWLFLVMINDLTMNNLPYGNSQRTPRSRKLFPSLVHQCPKIHTVLDVLRWSNGNRFKLN